MKCIQSLFAGALVLLGGCSSPKIEDYADHKPVLDIREYFNGSIGAWGVFLDRAGMADPSFYAKMKGTWNSGNGRFEEHFTYSDGHTQERIWTVHFTDEHHFTATAHDVIGEAKGAQYGNAMNMRYVLAVTSKGKTYNVSMDDWMYRIDENTILNRIEMTKFGFKVGELIITFHKPMH
jgi:Protein of unknown function (DUF3833)